MSEADATKPTEAAAPQVEEKPTESTTAEETKSEETKPETENTESKDEASDGKPNILKTTAKHDKENKGNNRKFDPSTREVTDDPVAIRKQVEFYFGDWNFPQDKFMWESCGGSENKPIPVKSIHSFKRMRTFQPYTAVVAALRDSDFLEVGGEEGEETIKRKQAYQPMGAGRAKNEAATVYVKGFGDEKPNTQFDLESFFANYGEVKGLKLRRTNDGLFKGSVFVTFADEETAKKFLELDPAPKWEEHDLKIMSKAAYCDEKSELIRQGKLEPNSQQPKKFFEGVERGGAKGGRGRGGFRGDSNDWKNRRDHDQKNGFKGRGGGRGGRGGRGRGGRGRGDRDRGGRDRDQDAPRDAAAEEVKESSKRSREEDGGAGEEPASKKVDTKTEVAAES
ncbi:la domain-containing protein [Sarocladium implicatum]|nr:la domain-containing protein [Sarocladium implicatum]